MKKIFILIIICAALQFLSPLGISFGETLEEAWKIGLQTDHLLKATEQDTISRQATLNAAKGRRLPTLNIGAGYTILDNEPAAFAQTIQFTTADDQSLTYQAMFSLPLYTHFQISSAIDAATANLSAGKFAEQAARQKVKLKIAEAYIAILLGIQQTDVAISHEQSLAAHASDVKNLHDEGMVPVNDLLAAKVALANARQLTLKTQNRLDIAQSAYNRLLNRPLDYKVQISTIPLLFPAIDLTVLSRDALKKRPELAALAEQIEALKWQAKSTKAESGPKVTLMSGYDYQENSHQLHEGVWQTMVLASWDIFDGNVAKNKSLALEAQSRSLAEQRQEMGTLIQLQVRQAWLDLDESRKRIEVTKETLEQAEENLQVTRNRYKEGIGTNTEVLDAETLRTINYVNYDKAGNDAVLAIIRLHYATGSL
ncbi:MAG: TolC family protein [Deltaproteobacteria bacterium]|nr:TolC family protein [Deltaproteobacteria bacterium]